MLHHEGCPYQISTDNDELNSAELRDHLCRYDDVVIIGSDGFWDNIDTNEILDDVNALAILDLTIDTKLCSEILMLHASRNSMTRKSDDITVLVGQIRRPHKKLVK
jgi:serine/threonine protein phosphatase PrpC